MSLSESAKERGRPVKLRARLAVIGARQLDAQTLPSVYSKLIERAQGDGHIANGAANILLDLLAPRSRSNPTT
jgi:hypothetical protein